MLQGEALGGLFEVRRRRVTAINIFIIEEVMILIFHPLGRLTGMAGMDAVIFGRGHKEYFRIFHVGTNVVIRRDFAKEFALFRFGLIIRITIFAHPGRAGQ